MKSNTVYNIFKLKIYGLLGIPYLNHIPGPRGVEFVKLMLHFQRDSLGALEETYKRYGPIVSYPWPISTVIVYETDIIKQVLYDKNQNYIKGSQTLEMTVVMGDGLVTNNNRATWLRNRQIILKEMGAGPIKSFSSIIEDFVEELVGCWRAELGEKQSALINISKSMRNITFSIAGKTLLGANLNKKDAEEVDEAVLFTCRMAHDHMFELFPVPYWMPTKDNREFKHHIKNLNRIVYRLIDSEKQNLKNKVLNDSSNAPLSILERLVRATDPDTNLPLDDVTLRDEVLTLLIAGYETTANTLCWVLGLIAQHENIQKELQEELDQNHTSINSIEFSKNYPLLYCTILEGIRIYTAIPMSSRKSVSSDYFHEYYIPDNTSVVIPVWVIHRDERFWNNPLLFDPGRFKGQDVNKMDAYIPFSKGPRRCVGEVFALVEVAIVVSKILRNFNLEINGNSLPRAVSHVSLKPENGLSLLVKKRKQI